MESERELTILISDSYLEESKVIVAAEFFKLSNSSSRVVTFPTDQR
jgi:hypothetical protein